MSETANETPEETSPTSPSDAQLAQTERMFLRLTLWQTVLSVLGVFIAIVALYAALTESAAVRQQTAAAVWPFVQFSIEESDTGEAADFTVSFANTGVGPARMRAMQVAIKGHAVSDWAEAVARLDGEITENVSRNFIGNRVLSPDETVDAFSTSDPDLARKFLAAVSRPDTYIAYCYCSIFDECWLADSRQSLQDPEPLESCPEYGEAAFRN